MFYINLYTTPTMILHEDMKPIEHVLRCVLSHLMCACKHYNMKLSLSYLFFELIGSIGILRIRGCLH